MRKVAIITGASSGIGSETAKIFAKNNYDLFLTYNNNREGIESLKRDLDFEYGTITVCFKADFSEAGTSKILFSTFNECFSRIDSLVNNAGTINAQSALVDYNPDNLQQLFRVNCFSILELSQLVARKMIEQKQKGSIVNVSSIASKYGAANEYVDYAMSKGALDVFTKGCAAELSKYSIRVNAVRPGFIETGIHAKAGEPSRIDRLAPTIPLQRGGSCREVAEAIFWLSSDSSSYCTGTLLDVAGGK